MGQTKKKLVVKEVKELSPLADVYELSPYCKYIVMLKRSQIALNQNAELMQKGREIIKIFGAFSIPCAIFVGSLEDMQIVELQAVKE